MIAIISGFVIAATNRNDAVWTAGALWPNFTAGIGSSLLIGMSDSCHVAVPESVKREPGRSGVFLLLEGLKMPLPIS
jgi:hypothetical protein